MSSTAVPPPAETATAPSTTSTGASGIVRRRARTSLLAHGQPLVWLTGGAVVVCVFMIAGLLLLVLVQGIATFWPQPVVEVTLKDGKTRIMGEVVRRERYRPSLATNDRELAQRELIRTGNFELTQEHYRWVKASEVFEEVSPSWSLVIERLTNDGRFYGVLTGFRKDGEEITTDPAEAWALYQRDHAAVVQRVEAREKIERDASGSVNRRERAARLAVFQAELDCGPDSIAAAVARERYHTVQAEAAEAIQRYSEEIASLNKENQRDQLVLRTAQGQTKLLSLGEIDRAYPANQLTLGQKLRIYLSRWWEFLTAWPRNANSEGGVFPAIWGTAVMTILMSLAVVPFGVMAALYLREYARAGPIVSVVRIAINNLAGVPSIVFGVFGLGFFCYIVGDSIDNLFFRAQKLADKDPTYGKGGLLWASLTLALLTLPVVIVATEEALAAVPRSMREGSYACGASKWQTIWRIVLPRAMPGILTGMILAMARGAGEVAPLMLVGAKKIAQNLPVDGVFPFLHPDRSFMHLGFHIYDVGFQSPDSESAKSMVYTTTLLLIVLIFALNLAAIWLRARLRKRHQAGHF